MAASWRRSVARGVDPATLTNRHHPDLDLDSRLVGCARPVIEQLAEQIAGAPVCLVLTDDRARLLVQTGHDGGDRAGRRRQPVRRGVLLRRGGGRHRRRRHHPGVGPVAARRGRRALRRVAAVLRLRRHTGARPGQHSLVTSAAARIQDALLHDRDAGQQAVFDLYTRVDARSRRAVLAVGRRMVLANTVLQTLLDPGDLAALQDHARFRMLPVPDVDDRLDLPSGVRIRMRGTAVTLGSTVAGLVTVISVLREADGIAVSPEAPDHPPVPEPASTSPAWRVAWTAAAEALRAGTLLLVVGEAGSGRRRLLADLDRAVHGPGHVVGIGPADADSADTDPGARFRGSGPATLVVLTDVDRWDGAPPGLPGALRASRARIAATARGAGPRSPRCSPRAGAR